MMANEGIGEMADKSEYIKKYGFSKDVEYDVFPRGLSEEIVRRISKLKGEPEWMLEKRLTGFRVFQHKPVPAWGADLSKIDFNEYYYYLKPKGGESKSWEDVPPEIKDTFDKLGVPEAERKFFSGAEAQFDSGVVYSHVNKELDRLGIIFTDTDSAVKKYPELMKKYFGAEIPATDNKFAALNTATWSGGSFIYVPKGVKVPMALNAYFRINAMNAGQFERTLIIADEGADVTYIEGCFIAGTGVVTDNGVKAIEEIKVGDRTLTHNGVYRRVYSAQVRQYAGKLYQVSYVNCKQDLNVTEEHPLLVVRREVEKPNNKNLTATWVKVSNVHIGDYLVMPISSVINHKLDILTEILSGNVKLLRSETLEDYALVAVNSISSIEVDKINVYNFSVEEDESYVAGGVLVHNCTAPVYKKDSLHAAVVELVALEGAHIRYVTIQNWSKNIYNLVTQRAHVAKNGRVEWIDANIGSKVNMKYPSIYLMGEHARGEVLSIAIAGDGQVQDSGGKIYHLASNTTSKIVSKSISKGSGVTTFRGLMHVAKNAANVKAHVSCDALLLDENAKTNTFPYNQINRSDAMVSHEARVGKISDDDIFYLTSRGIQEDDAIAMIVLGFIDDLTKVLPLEYSLELKRLIKLDTSNGIG